MKEKIATGKKYLENKNSANKKKKKKERQRTKAFFSNMTCG